MTFHRHLSDLCCSRGSRGVEWLCSIRSSFQALSKRGEGADSLKVNPFRENISWRLKKNHSDELCNIDEKRKGVRRSIEWRLRCHFGNLIAGWATRRVNIRKISNH